MKAIRIHQFGDSDEVLRYEDVDVPEPQTGQVLIKVDAASLNRADLSLRKGAYRISPDQLPVIPGREFAGTVEKLGANVTEFKLGQRVVGYPSLGGYAQYAIADAAEVRPVPEGVSSAEAAAVPTVFLTAWFGLLTDGNLKKGEWLL
jgi:NADPH:quinone reductase-like Zn-dependent oxidoreductase